MFQEKADNGCGHSDENDQTCSAASALFRAESQEIFYVEWRTLPHNSHPHPLSGNRCCCAKGYIRRFAIFRDCSEILRYDLTDQPQETESVADGLNIGSRLAVMLGNLAAKRKLLTRVSRFNVPL
jgi:hypothetical protein